MGRYKSLVVVAGMGCALVFLAGLLLETETMMRRGAKPAAEETSPPIVLDGQVIFAKDRGPAPTKPGQSPAGASSASVTEALAGIREALERKPGADGDGRRDVAARCALLERSLRAEHWPLLESELDRKGAPRGYAGVVLALAGATRADAAVRRIEAEYPSHRVKALEALAAHGGAAAFAAFRRLYARAGDFSERHAFIKALPGFEVDAASAFLVETLRGEGEPRVARELALVAKKLAGPGLVEPLAEELVRRADRDAVDGVAGRIASALAAHPEGAARLLGLRLETNGPVPAIAGQALRFARAPALVPRALASLPGAHAGREDLLAFIERNAVADHREAIATAREVLVLEPDRHRLEEILVGLGG
ncbi:MAG: hypothetical protein R3F20_18225 [Planctomycetota bacterium]